MMASGWTRTNPSLRYEIEGDGPPVLLLHEMGGSLRSWDGVAALLTPRHRVIRFDQRGAGLSEKGRARFDLADQVDDALVILDVSTVTGPILISSCAGAAATAVAIAAARPAMVVGLVLCAPALGITDEASAAALKRADLVEREGMRPLADAAMDHMYPAALRGVAFEAYRGRFLANDPVTFANANRAFARARPAYRDLAVPTLLLAGAMDIRPVEAIRALAGDIAGATVEVVQQAGHVMPVQQPEMVARHLTDFYAQHRVT